MYLIQILLPVYDNEGKHFPLREYTRVRDELTEHFGGITTYMRSPASGLWKESRNDAAVQDDIVIFEVMTDALDKAWWERYREGLCGAFRQEVLIVRVTEIQLL